MPKMFGLSSQDWFLYWDDTLVQTATSVQGSDGIKGIKVICYSPYYLDSVSANIFLFQRVKLEQAGLPLSQDSFKIICKETLEPNTRSPITFGAGMSAVTSVFNHGVYNEKKWEINNFLTQLLLSKWAIEVWFWSYYIHK